MSTDPASSRNPAPRRALAALVVTAAVLVATIYLWPRGDAMESQERTAGSVDVEVAGQLESGRLAAEPHGPAAGTPATAADRTARQAAPLRRSIQGVVQSGGRRSLDGASVRLVVAPRTEGALTQILSASQPDQVERIAGLFGPERRIAEQRLGPDGAFRFEEPPLGRYEIQLVAPLLRFVGTPIAEVGEDAHVDLGLLPTEAAPGLVVVVTRPDGSPVEGASIELSADYDPMAFADPSKLGDLFGILRRFIPLRAESDARGVHRFPGLRAAGAWLVTASASGLAPSRQSVHLADGMQQVVRLTLGAAARLAVVVTDAQDRPVAGARVEALPAPATPEAGGFFLGQEGFGRKRRTTDAEGQVEIDSLLPGKVGITVTAAGFLPHDQDRVLEADRRHEHRVVLDRGSSIHGVVRDDEDGAAIEGAVVANIPDLAQSFMGIDLGSMIPEVALKKLAERGGVRTDRDGKFDLSGLVAGEDAQLVAFAPDYELGRHSGAKTGATDVVIRLRGLGALRGRVVRDEDGAAVSDFRAYCVETRMLVLEVQLGGFERGESAGAFVLRGVPPGRRTLVVEAPQRRELRITVDVVKGDQDLGELRLGPPSAVEGLVVDSLGQPVEDARVRLSRGGIADYEVLAKLRGQEIAVTDADGRFRLEDVPSRRVRLLAEKVGYPLSKSETVRVEEGQVTEGVRLVLGRGGTLVGSVKDRAGRPLAGWRVTVKSDRAVTQRVGETDVDGLVRFDGMTPSVYAVQAFPPGWLTEISRQSIRPARGGRIAMPDLNEIVSATMKQMLQAKVTVRDEEESRFDLVWEEEGAGFDLTRVEGRVSIGGQPVARGFVELVDVGGKPRMRLATIEAGEFLFPALEAGSYRVRVRPGFMSPATFHDEVVDVPKQPSWRLDLALPGGRIAGRVHAKGSGEPVPHVVIQLRRIGDARHFNPAMLEDVGQGIWLTDQNGRFSFDGLAAGRYEVLARELSFVSGSAGVGRAQVELAAGQQRADVDIRLGVGARIDVRVLDATGPHKAALVRLLDATGRPAEMFQPTITDAQGEASFAGLPGGSYRVLVDDAGSAPTTSRVVDLVDDGEQRVELTLVDGVEVRIQIVGELPVTRIGEIAVCSVWDPDGKLVRAGPVALDALRAQKEGLRFGELRPGRYRARVESPSLGVFETEREVPPQRTVVWRLDLSRGTLERR